MNRATLLVVALDFSAIGILPLMFFRRDGRLNLMWWLTGGPFFVCPLLLIGVYLGLVPLAPRYGSLLGPGQDLLPIVPALASIALIFLTLGTHRVPIALWHQSNDAPRHIVTWGAYRFIRHPFYTSFLLAFMGAGLLFPHPIVLLLGLYVAVILNRTAAGEERKLTASELGEEYAAYVRHTGRFVPRWGRS